MDIYTGIGIVVSIVALIISYRSYLTTKAINNQVQLQNNYLELCQRLQTLINFGSENNLTTFKYDVENFTLYDKDSVQCGLEYNNLQKKYSEQKIQVKSAYMQVLENFDFLRIQTIFPTLSKENQFDKWLNETVNTYFLKLDRYYTDLYQICTLAKYSQSGVPTPEEKRIIDAFYDNVIDIIKTSQALQFLKSTMVGRFKKLSVREINVFKNNEELISNIKKELYTFVIELGIDDAIKGNDFSKIKKICPDFGDQFDSFINEEKTDYVNFLRILRTKASKGK